MSKNQRMALCAALLAAVGSSTSTLAGPRTQTVGVPTSSGNLIYRVSALNAPRSAATLLSKNKAGRTIIERGYVLTNRVIVRCDDPSAIAAPQHTSCSTIAGLDGYLLIDTRSVREAVTLAHRMRSVQGVQSAHVDVARPTANRSVPTDPFIDLEWQFNNTQDPGIDANFLPAWQAGYSGAGVIVGVVERGGVDADHPDLAANYIQEASIDARFLSDHPTSVAGVVAMVANNDLGGAGGAYASQIASVSTRDGTASEVATAFLHRNDLNDIKNNSWGPRDDPRLDPIDPIEVDALREGAISGRSGLGEIYVWAAGNGGTNQIGPDRVDYDQYAASRFTIAVGAYDDDGDAAAYNEVGSPMLICAPSDGTFPDNRGIFSTERNGDFTESFGGTSAAAPVAASAIALMLEANPQLTWRDVQHILVESARIVDPTSDGWEPNGSGRLVHYSYGYGSVDAAAAVTMSETWSTVGPETLAGTGTVEVATQIPDNDVQGIEQFITIDKRLLIESVELNLNIVGEHAGDLDIRLVSPSGFESFLAEVRNDSTDGYQDWTFTSLRHWGELSQGEWTVQIADLTAGDEHLWQDFELRVFGTEIAFCPADLSGSSIPGEPDYDVPDGDVDADDFFRYLDLFVAGDSRADLTGSNDPNDPGYGVPDGIIDSTDFFFYLELFSQGCD